MPSSSPTGIVTGAASGIGLAITTHLVSKGWRVVMADMNATAGEAKASSLGPNARFHQTDVSSWDDQAALFKAAWDWSGRLDFFAANAGIDDKEDVFKVWSLDEEPKKPNLKTLDVDLNAVFEGMKLFVHYVRKSGEGKGGKMVVTASMMGIYPFETNPQYSAAKHGVGVLFLSGS
jgi:15-hydroxyprostaglandin dehydrogenase (NAD)